MKGKASAFHRLVYVFQVILNDFYEIKFLRVCSRNQNHRDQSRVDFV